MACYLLFMDLHRASYIYIWIVTEVTYIMDIYVDKSYTRSVSINISKGNRPRGIVTQR